MPGSPTFATAALLLTFVVTLWGGLLGGPDRIVPLLILVGPLFLPPFFTLDLPILDLDRVTAVTSAALLLLFFTRGERWRALRFFWPDALLVAFVGWSTLSVSVNQGGYAACSRALYHSLLYIVPYLAGRLYLQSDDDLQALVRGAMPFAFVYAVICPLEMVFYPFVSQTLYGESPTGVLRWDLVRPVGTTQNSLEMGNIFSLLAVLIWVARRGGWFAGDRALQARSRLALWACVAVVLTTMSRGPMLVLVLGLVVPRVFKATRFVAMTLALAGIALFFWMIGPGSGVEVGSLLFADTSVDTNLSVLYRFMQIDVFKPMVAGHELFGWGEAWPRTGLITIIDGVLLATILAGGYPSAILLCAFWAGSLWICGRHTLPRDDPWRWLGAGFVAMFGFLVFSAWGDSFIRAPQYLVLGALPLALARVREGRIGGTQQTFRWVFQRSA